MHLTFGKARPLHNAKAHLPRRQVRVEARTALKAAAVRCSGWLAIFSQLEVAIRQGQRERELFVRFNRKLDCIRFSPSST